jgi:hypothetical protein
MNWLKTLSKARWLSNNEKVKLAEPDFKLTCTAILPLMCAAFNLNAFFMVNLNTLGLTVAILMVLFIHTGSEPE